MVVVVVGPVLAFEDYHYKRSLVMLFCFCKGPTKLETALLWGNLQKQAWIFQVKMEALNLARWMRGILSGGIFLLTKTIPWPFRLSSLCFLPRKYSDLRENLNSGLPRIIGCIGILPSQIRVWTSAWVQLVKASFTVLSFLHVLNFYWFWRNNIKLWWWTPGWMKCH